MAARGGRSGVWKVQKILSIRMASCGSFLSPLFPSLLFRSPDLSRSFHTSPDLPDLPDAALSRDANSASGPPHGEE